ncbi:MAG: YjbH domain-containing protein [Methylococcales bacterium]|jgi:hypothetical protein|nr:YjbH domain-containing protein [Methylococcales bacterium]MBT7410543.1 YjbH domain-containing protein [Methylococcales bacterium]
MPLLKTAKYPICIVFSLLYCQLSFADPYRKTNSDFGGVGLLQMPNARMMKDGNLSIGCSSIQPYNRCYFNTQVFPWMEALFRYTSITNRFFGKNIAGDQSFKDKGFDVKFKLLDEDYYFPSVAVGFRDIGGTSLFASEYVVASKRVYNVDLTFGFGWGNMGTRGHMTNPFTKLSDRFKSRSNDGGTTGGELTGNYFSGETMSIFAGLQYQFKSFPNLIFSAEFDGNSYQNEPLSNNQPINTPINVGFNYKLWDLFEFSLGWERGNKIQAGLSINLDLTNEKILPKFDQSPQKIQPRSINKNLTHITLLNQSKRVIKSLEKEKFTVESVSINKSSKISVNAHGGQFRKLPQETGRIARIVANNISPEIELIEITEAKKGLNLASMSFLRKDLEKAEKYLTSTDEIWMNSEIKNYAPQQNAVFFENKDYFPRFNWSVSPGWRQHVGGPDGFYLYQLFASIKSSYAIKPGLLLSSQLGLDIFNNFDKLKFVAESQLPRVRSNIKEYLQEGENGLYRLQLDYMTNLSENFYARLSAGLFEIMYGGLSAEILYRQLDSRWTFGIDVNQLKQRAFDVRFDFLDYEVTTGHFTTYYDIPKYDILAQVSVGRYLANDSGVSFDISRYFDNGVSIGIFATKTKVSSTEFGEGGFDKGFYIQFPLDMLLIKSSKETIKVGFTPLTRDGGQKVVVGNRLYEVTKNKSLGHISKNWGALLQ